LGLKTEVVEKAKEEMGGATDEVNQVIAGLEAQRRRQEEKAAQAQDLLQQAERFYKEVSAKATDLEEREKSLRASQEIAVQQEIASAKGEIAAVIKRLQEGKPTAQDAKKATDNINKLAERFIPKAEPKQKVGFMPKVGERIRIPKLGQTAEVLSAPDEDGEFNVRFGIMKMTVKLEDVESLTGEKAKSPAKAKPAAKAAPPPAPVENTPLIRTSKNTVDLRGRRVADSEIILDKAISEVDRAIWIIHGHGTGKLRQGVHAFLKQHPRISHYEAAPQNDGGTGVTIAYIKS
jgi:DNA mismatch repair protein MutS2